MQALILTLISQFFSRQRNLDELWEALDYYEANEKSPARQLRLEAAFFKAYKKPASAKFLARLAYSNWGPREAFNVFGRTSVAVSCDFNTHNIRLSRWFNHGSSKRVLIALMLGLTFLMLGMASVLSGFVLMIGTVSQVYLAGGDEILKVGVEKGIKVFSTGSIGIAVTVFGGFLGYMGWGLIMALEIESKALKLYEELNPTDS
ncbi:MULTISPECIES: hypothetical protein [unclassified Halomonas]|uniref:hypothetical protein n=1 Tax=unclassified Halomonas TaxID=2609666 RepID=UPI0007F14BE9|nr:MULTISPECIES: hypothetical protein [unclassified Halomonas]SBR47401.1 hypothetical protein GA0071314_1185 [Halomonas sp. HL-93]SNY99196.1 hypothetical protein SAMN04488142_3835 [Halomonas sp. hl-4]